MKKIITIATLALSTLQVKAQTSSNWTQINVPTIENLNDIAFVHNSFGIGYIGGDNGTLLKTIDGSNNWTNVNFTGVNPGVPFNVMYLEFVSPTIGFMILDITSGFYKTIDGGSTWIEDTDFELGNQCYKKAVHSNDENNLFLAGAGCFQRALINEYNAPTWTDKSF